MNTIPNMPFDNKRLKSRRVASHSPHSLVICFFFAHLFFSNSCCRPLVRWRLSLFLCLITDHTDVIMKKQCHQKNVPRKIRRDTRWKLLAKEAELNEAIQRSLETQEVYPCRSQLEFMEKKERIFFPVLGDGDCMLYSILALLRYDPQWQEVRHPYADLTSIELREKMLEWFIENKDTIVWAPNEEGVPVHQAVLQNAEGFSDCL